MPFRIFTIPISHGTAAEAELNAFLRNHKVLQIERRWIDQGANSCWTFCVDYAEPTAAGNGAMPGRGGSVKGRTDYREILSPEDFAVFAKLRDVRKQIAQAEGVPVYMVFTNDQLARIVQKRAGTKAALEEIAGVGDARVEKYGGRMLEFLTPHWHGSDETDGKPV